MNLTIQLNESDLEELLKLYTRISPLLKGKSMLESIYELNCEYCDTEWELTYIEHETSNQPIYCPFCGSNVDLDKVDEESDDFDIDDLDFEKD